MPMLASWRLACDHCEKGALSAPRCGFCQVKNRPRLQMSMPEGYGMDLCCSIGGGGGGQSLNQPLDCQLTDWHLFCPILSSMRKFSEPEPAPKVRKPRAEEVFTRRRDEKFSRAPRTEEVFSAGQADVVGPIGTFRNSVPDLTDRNVPLTCEA